MAIFTNVGVSWSFSMLESNWPFKSEYWTDDDDRWNQHGKVLWDVMTMSRVGAIWIQSTWTPESDLDLINTGDNHSDIVPLWTGYLHLTEQFASSGIEHQIEKTALGFGWPMLSMSYEYSKADNSMHRMYTGAIEFGRTEAPLSETPLPVRIIWIGFTVSTMFYFCLWITVLLGFPLLRQWNRIRRGLCPKCAYNLHKKYSQGCPECGFNK